MTARTVVYDSGVLVALLCGKGAAVVLHHALRAAARLRYARPGYRCHRRRLCGCRRRKVPAQ
jgi:hypothetical protein